MKIPRVRRSARRSSSVVEPPSVKSNWCPPACRKSVRVRAITAWKAAAGPPHGRFFCTQAVMASRERYRSRCDPNGRPSLVSRAHRRLVWLNDACLDDGAARTAGRQALGPRARRRSSKRARRRRRARRQEAVDRSPDTRRRAPGRYRSGKEAGHSGRALAKVRCAGENVIARQIERFSRAHNLAACQARSRA
jgi:hypothetical protein